MTKTKKIEVKTKFGRRKEKGENEISLGKKEIDGESDLELYGLKQLISITSLFLYIYEQLNIETQF